MFQNLVEIATLKETIHGISRLLTHRMNKKGAVCQ